MARYSAKTIIVTGAAGALGSAYVRALVPAGYHVVGIDRRDSLMKVYKKRAEGPYQVLGNNDLENIRIHGTDLLKPGRRLRGLFSGSAALVMCAANPDPYQNRASANKNHSVDMNTVKAALDSKVKTIIYLSSVWRLKGLLEGDSKITPEMSAPESYYGENKQRTVDELKTLAEQNPDVMFVYNDHGWYPRETKGAPPTNATDRALQCWVAERETQEHILKQLDLINQHFKGNFHGFLVVSKNVPTKNARNHRPFIFDISASRKLGVKHQASIYRLIEYHWKWRDHPLYTY